MPYADRLRKTDYEVKDISLATAQESYDPLGNIYEGDEIVGISCEPGIHAVILGGETGPGARPTHPDWVQSVRDQCQAAGVPFFFKQWGEWAPWGEDNCNYLSDFNCDEADKRFKSIATPPYVMYRVGSKRAGRLLDGREWNELPWRNDG